MAFKPTRLIAADAAGSPQPAAAAPPPPLLLVIDDNEGVCAAVKVIAQLEFRVETVNTGREALAMLQKEPVDVVTLDLDLGGESGICVLDQIKQHDPLIEVIILTGHATLETAREAIQLGAFAYLTKPFETQECRRLMRAALERRRQMVGWRTLELEVQKRQVDQDIDRTRAEIYATVIHDLNTPLTAASGLLELLMADLRAAGRASEIEQPLQDIGAQLHFCMEIIKRYLGFMRRAPGQAASTELSSVLADLNKLIRAHSAARHHRLLVHVPDEHYSMAVNGVDLLQVLLNLTVNALQASENSHHVEVYCRHWPVSPTPPNLGNGPNDFYLFSERLTAGSAMVSVTVQDDGAGIPPEALPRVFDSFHTTKSAGKGTGLGLTVIRRIVDENNGALHVCSVMGEGTAFTVFFPAT